MIPIMRGSDARRKPAVTQPISGHGYGAASRARRGGEAEAASSPCDENVALEMHRDDRWTKHLCASTATRVLLAMALFGIIGTLLPVFAMRLGVRVPQVAKTGPRRHAFTAVGLGDGRDHVARGVSTSGAFSGRGVAGLGAYGGETSLIGTPLKPCSGPDQAEATGWDRSGSCAWDPTDSGYHEVRSTPTNPTETTRGDRARGTFFSTADVPHHPFPRRAQVCVRMDERFLANSASVDGNDLSSVVGHGEHWCVCAWAFASAVDRDPTGMEGLQLMCEESNAKLRDVYQHYIDAGEGLTGPTGNSYGPTEALNAVNRLCPEPDANWDVIAQSGLMAA